MKREIPQRWLWLTLGILVVIGVLFGVVLKPSPSSSDSAAASSGLATNPNLDPGTPLNKPAPDFTLTDQFGRPMSMRAYRGKVVLLAFNDSQCTTVCPLTTTAMVDAKRFLGADGAKVALLGIDANPQATTVADVRSYSRVHDMLYAWRFGTGSVKRLEQVWKAYDVAVQIEGGQIDHTPALFAIDPQGRLRKVWMTQMNYASVPQLGQLLAREASALLPDHPAVHSDLSYATVAGISPRTRASLSRAGGGSLAVGGAGSGARLLLFFDSWSTEAFPDLKARLALLNRYVADAGRDGGRAGLAPLTAVDEASVEPSPSALPAFLHSLRTPLRYPVAIDPNGRLADGYEVQDQPYFVLTSASGRIAWYWDISTQGWPSLGSLEREVRGGLAHVSQVAVPSSAAAVPAALSGSPAPLAGLHDQAARLLGSGLMARVKALKGYPVVINAWASWCGPCQSEFGLFQSASIRYGTKVAFVGADTNDSAGNARGFLAKHPVSYPSYELPSTGSLSSLAQIEGLPTTIFVGRSGKVAGVHIGQYTTEGTLDSDIQTYALGG